MSLVIDKFTKREMVGLLRDLIRIKSTNPPGNENEMANYVKDYMEVNDIETHFVPLEEGRSSVVGVIPGSKSGSLALCGHLDTVNVIEDSWSKPPFEGLTQDGRIYGRGSSDMKGGVAVILQVAKMVASTGTLPTKNLIVAFTADEEKGYRGAKSLVEEGFFDNTEFLLVAEPSDGQVFIGEKGELWMEALFSGKSAHGAIPDCGVNTILPGANFCRKLMQEVETFPKNELLGEATLNIGQFDGGWQINIVPDKTRIKLDFRILYEEDKDTVIELVDRLGQEVVAEKGADFGWKIISYQLPIICDPKDYYISNFLRAASDKEVSFTEPSIAPYCTDASVIIPELDLPLIIYGPGAIRLAHQPDEYVEIRSLEQSLKTIVKFLNNTLGF